MSPTARRLKVIGITQAALAERLGVARTTIVRAEAPWIEGVIALLEASPAEARARWLEADTASPLMPRTKRYLT